MKKIAVFLAVIMLLVLIALPTFAYNGIKGATFDSVTNAPWEHGGKVFMFGTVGGTPNQLLGQGILSLGPARYGRFNVPYAVTPDDGTNVTVVITFNDGGAGTPQGQQFTNQFTHFTAITGRYSMGNIKTGTGPNAVTLQDFGTTASNLPLLGIGLVVLLLVSVTFISIRRRQNA